MIPALCCDDELYAEIAIGLADLVEPLNARVGAPTLSACVAQVLEQVTGPFIAMGTSFGGHVVREAALSAPERVTGLWIMGAGAGGVADPAGAAERSRKLRSGQADEVHRQFAATITHLPGPRGAASASRFLAMAERAEPERMALQNDALMARPDRWADVHRIACPTLLLWGTHDRFSSAADGRRLSGLIPKARFVEIPDCGHLPTLEAPGEVVDTARHWLLASGLAAQA